MIMSVTFTHSVIGLFGDFKTFMFSSATFVSVLVAAVCKSCVVYVQPSFYSQCNKV